MTDTMTDTTTWTELISQPRAWQALLDRLAEPGQVPALSLADFDEVVLVGSGTSYYLAMAAADFIRRRFPIRVRAVASCEVMLDPIEVAPAGAARRLGIGFSRSGESSELVLAIQAMKAAGFTVLSVGCTEGSSLLGLGDHVLHVPEGYEDGLVMLRSFTGMLIAVQYLFGGAADRAALRRLPELGRAVLADYGAAIKALSNRRDFDRFVFLASGTHYPLGVEASLKIQEMSISTSEAYHSLEYRHGPKATANADTLISMIALSDRAHGLSLARDVKRLDVTLLVVGPDAGAYAQVADLAIATGAGLGDGPASAITLLPLQIMAFETAMRRGRNPDAPANLSKVVVF